MSIELKKIKIFAKASLYVVLFIVLLSAGAIGALVYNFVGSHIENFHKVNLDTANTFILFTTFIFIAITAVMTLGGFILLHKLSSNEEKSILILEDKFIEKICQNGHTEKLIGKIFDNDNIRSAIEERFSGFIRSTINTMDKRNKSESTAIKQMADHFDSPGVQ
jgi:hypothetical protein